MTAGERMDGAGWVTDCPLNVSSKEGLPEQPARIGKPRLRRPSGEALNKCTTGSFIRQCKGGSNNRELLMPDFTITDSLHPNLETKIILKEFIDKYKNYTGGPEERLMDLLLLSNLVIDFKNNSRCEHKEINSRS